jgi:hypothetical protein
VSAGDGWPESDDPIVWRHLVDQVDGELEAMLAWHASCELDGEAVTVRRAIDEVLGEGPPLLIEVGAGQVLKLRPPGGQP